MGGHARHDFLRDRHTVRRQATQKLLGSNIRTACRACRGQLGEAWEWIAVCALGRRRAAGGPMANWRRITGTAGLVMGATAAGAGAVIAARSEERRVGK